MTAASAGVSGAPQPLHGERATGWWGMICLIGTEATLFALLIFSYFYLRWNSPRWPPDGIKLPDFTVVIPATILLLTSSGPMQWAEWSIRRGRRRQLKLGLVIAMVEAVLFVALTLYEWSKLDFTPQLNSYGSLFFTITGIHLLHVTGAVCMALYLLVRASLGHFSSRRFLAVENVTLYWHFVDLVWVAIFSSLYISPYIR
ncbi:MAG: cytochrome c oxidase subunit 3 [Dehalococcoidia bacterium]